MGEFTACSEAEQSHSVKGYATPRGKLEEPEDLVSAERGQRPVDDRETRAQHRSRSEMNVAATGATVMVRVAVGSGRECDAHWAEGISH